MAFDANEHMIKFKGKDYLQVAWRLVWFRDVHPDWCINTDCVEQDEEHAIFKAVIADENGVQKSVGHGSESKRDFGDFLEKAETKAVGRALAMLGFGTQFAADELDEGERIVDAPIDRKPKEKPVYPKPGVVTIETPENSKAKYINALKQNAVVAYGENAEEKLNELLTRFGITLDTMTSPLYRQINAIITKGETK